MVIRPEGVPRAASVREGPFGACERNGLLPSVVSFPAAVFGLALVFELSTPAPLSDVTLKEPLAAAVRVLFPLARRTVGSDSEFDNGNEMSTSVLFQNLLGMTYIVCAIPFSCRHPRGLAYYLF